VTPSGAAELGSGPIVLDRAECLQFEVGDEPVTQILGWRSFSGVLVTTRAARAQRRQSSPQWTFDARHRPFGRIATMPLHQSSITKIKQRIGAWD
jgi:hypothetical protein